MTIRGWKLASARDFFAIRWQIENLDGCPAQEIRNRTTLFSGSLLENAVMPLLELGIDRSHSHMAISSLSLVEYYANPVPCQALYSTILPVMAKKVPLGKTPLGELLERSRQRGRDPETGDSYSQASFWRDLKRRGLNIQQRSYASVENEAKLVKPEIVNKIAELLDVTVLEMVRAMGYVIRFEGMTHEGDEALLEAFHDEKTSDQTRQNIRLILGLGSEPRDDQLLRPLRHLAERDRQGRLETQE